MKSLIAKHNNDSLPNKSEREITERFVNQPFPQHHFMLYVKSMSNYEKLLLSIQLKLPFTRKDLKQWPDPLFFKKLSMIVKKHPHEKKIKHQLILFLLERRIKQLPPLEDLKSELSQLLNEHNYWNVFWSLYYHDERMSYEEEFQAMLKELEGMQQIIGGAEMEVAAGSQMLEPTIEEQTESMLKVDKKIAVLEEKISREISIRQQLELASVQKDKIYRQLQQEYDKSQQYVSLLKEQLKQCELKIEAIEKRQEEIAIKRKEEEERWLQERANLLMNNKNQLDELKKSSQIIEGLHKELEESRRQSSSWQQLAQQRNEEINHLISHKQPLEKQLLNICEEMYMQLEQYNQELVEQIRDHGINYEQRLFYRQQMMNILQITDSIDKFQQEAQKFEQSKQQERETPIHAEQLFTKEELRKVLPNIELTSEKQHYGTFYRRDHGGYIELDNGEQFNITESLVQQLELQHEAEVLCTPTAHPGRANHYTIELLFQGDDNYSPVLTFDGFILLDKDEKWYCVDINDESNRYPIHFKDIEIQKPANGDPCTFNVAEDGHIARLTKLYRVVAGESSDFHPARKRSEARPKAASRVKVEPFLTDCTVTIIGGQRKWFESVVTETGATLVHDGGEHPERIASDLSRSQALFMILTSTSHRATWEGIEIAKNNNIPHFTIQGSKSNLRKLLHENQDIIRNANRGIKV